MKSSRIVIATIGSLGDLHPCLALALELQRRGHRPVISTTPFYAARVQELGLEFHAMRPDWSPADSDLIRQCEDLKSGPEILYRKMVLPQLPGTYEDLLAVARTADLLLAGELVYAAPLVSEKLKLPWASIILSPFSFFSAIDPSVMVNAPRLIHLRKLGVRPYRMALDLGRLATRHWSNPVRDLRRREGLRVECDPVFRDKFSPWLVLALFSKALAAAQPDWPPQTVQPGFLQFESPADPNLVAQLTDFLSEGDPPIVFTQGSTAVHHPGEFYEVSAAAAMRLGRAILLGIKTDPKLPGVLALPYMPYSRLFPHAAAIVHQGGSGTTGDALRAGRPMLFVPYGWDQPDNAARIERQGAGLHVPRAKYTVDTATAALHRLLDDPQFARQAGKLGRVIAAEDALRQACDAIESLL
ncbi:MAG TPA: nucleotide disphospho-sugar-binding domain-containing protein [Bryobacteraceae bacterium]|nr:nucleotide disphospho-sugar-binding domain-containing protein [Bryobacteraceae bacterium]